MFGRLKKTNTKSESNNMAKDCHESKTTKNCSSRSKSNKTTKNCK